MLRTRLLSAAVFIPLAVVLLILGGWVYAVAVGIVLAICGFEYVAMMRRGGYQPYQRTMVFVMALIVGIQGAGLTTLVLGPGLAAFLLVAMVAMLAAYSNGDKLPAVNFGLTVGGTLYIGWLGAHAVALRQLPDGLYWALIGVLATGFADVGAYFVGRAVGRHKMAPVVSPGKTWEGFLGGVVTAAAVGALVAALALSRTTMIRVVHGAVIGLLVGILSPVGDLGMSTLKRMVGAKNFSNIIPGHGGMLDRFDSILVGVPVSFYVAAYFVSQIP